MHTNGCGCGESWDHEEQGSGSCVKEVRGVGRGSIRVCVLLVCGEVWRRGGVACGEGRVEGPLEVVTEDVFDF